MQTAACRLVGERTAACRLRIYRSSRDVSVGRIPSARQIERMEDFRKLRIYCEARTLLRELVVHTRRFPPRYQRLASQLEDAADSIGSNIAEGCGRKNTTQSNVELIRYVHISFGEACEVEHRLGTARDRRLLNKKHFYQLES